MTEYFNNVILGDCLTESNVIPDGSVDLILTDLPYGNMRGIDSEYVGYGRKNGDGHVWDLAIDPKLIYEIANRILRKNGKLVLFSQEPYTTRLINKAIPNIPFSYRAIWEKNDFANALLCNKAMVGYYEDILVFSKTHDTDAIHPLRQYFAKVVEYIGLSKKAVIDTVGQRADHVLRTNSTQFALCTKPTYEALIEHYGIDHMEGFKTYEELRHIDESAKSDLFPSTFNLWEGGKYKSNILKYRKDYNGYHPTQKPVLLLEDLIKTFSNEGDYVVDLTAGSGSTAVACINANRNFTVIEQKPEYVEIANKRIADAIKTKQPEDWRLIPDDGTFNRHAYEYFEEGNE